MNARWFFALLLFLLFVGACNDPNKGITSDPDPNPDPVVASYSLILEQAGTLSQLLTDQQWSAARELTVAGPMNVADFEAIKFKGVKVSNIDLSKAITDVLPDMAFCLAASSKSQEEIRGMDSLACVVLPEGTVEIGFNAFAGCRKLTQVTLPSTLRKVGSGAFSLTSIAHIDLPEGLTIIDHEAFVACDRLRSVGLPSTLDSIGFYAFMQCEVLEQVVLPRNLSKLGVAVFEGCFALERVRFEGQVELTERLFSGCRALVQVENLPEVAVIPVGLFLGCNSLAQIDLPPAVRRIEAGAFLDCLALETISIPAGVEWLGEMAFGRCQSLREVEWNGNEVLDTIQGMTFVNCRALETMVFPTSVTEIWENAMVGCRSLRSVVLPKGLTVLGQLAFGHCLSLAEVTIPASLKNMAFNARPFWGCAALVEPKLEVGSTVVADYLFAGAGVERITIPSTVSSIGHYAFDSTALEHIVLPEGLTELGVGAFHRCAKLVSVWLPSSLTHYEASLFEGCTALSSVELLSPTANQLSYLMFAGCKSLESITLPPSLQVLGYGCLRGTGLKSIVLPSGVKEIRAEAFRDCVDLVSVRIECAVPPMLENTHGGDQLPYNSIFFGLPSDAVLSVPKGSVDAYLAKPFYGDSFVSVVGY